MSSLSTTFYVRAFPFQTFSFYWVFPRKICEINAKYQRQKHSSEVANFVSGYRFAAWENVFSMKDKVKNRFNQSLLCSMQRSYAMPVVRINNRPSNSCVPAHQADSSIDMDQTLAGHRTFFLTNSIASLAVWHKSFLHCRGYRAASAKTPGCR